MENERTIRQQRQLNRENTQNVQKMLRVNARKKVRRWYRANHRKSKTWKSLLLRLLKLSEMLRKMLMSKRCRI